ncbi:MAG: hypothetical protein PHC68_04105 [Syntrophorhabdaceae bacterium]|nr:hypothetical protein [Syntrophorhabdaceae bacterium]
MRDIEYREVRLEDEEEAFVVHENLETWSYCPKGSTIRIPVLRFEGYPEEIATRIQTLRDNFYWDEPHHMRIVCYGVSSSVHGKVRFLLGFYLSSGARNLEYGPLMTAKSIVLRAMIAELTSRLSQSHAEQNFFREIVGGSVKLCIYDGTSMDKLSNWHPQGPNRERRKLGWLWAITKPHSGGWYWRVGQVWLGAPEFGSCAKTLWGACAKADEKLRELGVV